MYKEKIENIQKQRKQVKSELSEFEEAMLNREELLHKIDGALEMLVSLQKEKEEEDSNKDNKKDKN